MSTGGRSQTARIGTVRDKSLHVRAAVKIKTPCGSCGLKREENSGMCTIGFKRYWT